MQDSEIMAAHQFLQNAPQPPKLGAVGNVTDYKRNITQAVGMHANGGNYRGHSNISEIIGNQDRGNKTVGFGN